jgi:dTMP kinase
MGLFIVFEGIEGSGKTTQIRKAGDYLAGRNIPCVITSEPGGTALGEELRHLLLHRTTLPLGVKAELLLFAADRAQHVEEVILPALKAGTVVLCDRFSDATVAYQGYGRGWDIDAIQRINDFATQFLKPDLTFLFDVPVDTGLERIERRASRVAVQQGRDGIPDDRFEKEQKAFHTRVRNGYLSVVNREPERFRVIDASMDIDAIHTSVCRCLRELIEH